MNISRPRTIGAVIGAALALTGCSDRGDTTATPTPSQDAANALPEIPVMGPEIPVMGPEVPILALGDSLFAGYGLQNGQSYPAQLERALRARGINARIANAGVSGNTTADGLQRLAFTLDNQPKAPALAIISLGGNDMLRGLPPAQTRASLDAILGEFDQRHIPVVLMGMLAAPNLGADYARTFNAIYPALAAKHHAALVPFFLQAVVDKPDLVQADHIHPTARGVQDIVGATIDTVARAAKKP